MTRRHRFTAQTRWLLAAACWAPAALHAGAYVFANSTRLDSVTHPQVYTGTGGTLANLTICIDTSVNPVLAAQAEGAVIKAVRTFNRLRSIPNNNLAFNAATDIPAGQVDFESTLLHEMGHCQGLAHPNHATESGIAEPGRNGTKSTVGANTVFDQAAGADGLHGSRDDLRNDDLNLHWYIRNQNNPGLLPASFDSSALVRDLGALPAGHLFAANADRDVLNALGFPATEAVMQQGAFTREAQRHLQHDDVTTLRLARSGLDRTAGTADDYTYALQYVGQLNNPPNAQCNLRVRLDTSTSFAVCGVSGSTLSNGDLRVTSANLAFNSDTAFFFSPAENTVTTITDDTPDPSSPGQSYVVSVTVREAAGISITGEPAGTVLVSDDSTPPSTCTITLAGTVNETGSCALSSPTVGTRTLSAQYLGFAGWDASGGTATHTVNVGGAAATTTTITSDTPDPSVVGQAYAVAVTVSSAGGTPTGSVTVSDGSATCTIATLAGGSGTCNLTSTTAGNKTLTATYAGNASFATSNGSTAHLVNKANTSTTITADTPDPSGPGQAVTVSYSVVATAPGAGSPGGNVTVSASGGSESCTGTVAAGSCAITLTVVGGRTLTATYASDANFNGSTSAGVAHTVSPLADAVFANGFE